MGSEARTRVALLVLLVVTLFSFGQVFDRGEWPGPALLGMAVCVALVMAARRAGLSTWWTIVASLAALVWYLCVIFRMQDLFFGLPTTAAVARIWESVEVAYAKSQLDYAPVPVRTGYVIMTIVGMWLATTIGEIATFRWRRPLVATLPLVGLFSFLTVVGTRIGTTFPVLMFLAALLVYLATESSHRLRSWGSWVTSFADRRVDTPGEVSSRLARRMGASCLAAALFAPTFLPAIGDGLLSWRNPVGVGPGEGAGGPGGTFDLLASLQPRLIEQSSAEMFLVTANQPDYWRLTSLVEFDGTTWTPLEQQYKSPLAQGLVSSSNPPETGREITQEVSVVGLEGEFMPAAVQATTMDIVEEVDGRSNNQVTYDFETGTVELGGGLVEGLVYETTSLVARPTFRELMTARPGDVPGDTLDEYADEGPIPISREVRQLIEEWTAGAASPFAELVAIQNNLRQFAYTVDVPAVASTDHLTDFLIRTQRGYCQQFAAAFALIARYLGYSARVSVGFLPGETTISAPTRFTVRGTDAHAWPEVLFEEYGWVRFEPTPGNGASPPTYTARRPGAAQAPLLGDPRRLNDPGNPLGLEGNQNVPVGGRDRGGPVDTEGGQRGGRPAWEQTFARLLSVMLLALLSLIPLVPLTKALRTALRYRSARTPVDLAAAAFAHFETDAAELASPRLRAESASGFARRMGAAYRVPKGQAIELASIYERAVYGPSGVDMATARRARRLAHELRTELWSGASWWQRLQRLFSPTGLLTSR